MERENCKRCRHVQLIAYHGEINKNKHVIRDIKETWRCTRMAKDTTDYNWGFVNCHPVLKDFEPCELYFEGEKKVEHV